MYSPRIVYTVLLAAALLTIAASVGAQEVQTGVIATGTAEIMARPDTAFVNFGVITEARDAATAARENATKTTAVIDAIVQFGINRDNIQTSGYSVSPIMDYKQSPPITVGYRVSNQVQVKVQNLDRMGALIDTAIGAGANNVQGVRFTLEDDDSVRREALVQAIRNAQDKARVMADTLGVRLGAVKSVTESSGFTPPPIVFGAARAEAAETPIIPGEVTVNANVTIVYAIL